MQWVGFALQKLALDARSGGLITDALLGDARAVDGNVPKKAFEAGCRYVTGFVLPLALELGLKSLLHKCALEPPRTHNLSDLFDLLPVQTKDMVEQEYETAKEDQSAGSFRLLLEAHKNDFIEWRYLDDVKALRLDDRALQYAICAVLTTYERS